ncbi:MAG: [FeFe] hydrogenase H-cluster radical SAM maturase HydG [Candidatus Omnitrophica bacterium CG1_02_49_10]|nr:MAG: [FeFe] hydrogenase H-cluster radical SAM maturase HydG [Candidatus Omnitrophica bacterium CG1_02_49_10]
MKNFINEDKIFGILAEAKKPASEKVSGIVDKSLKLKGLSPEEAAVLLNCEDGHLLERIFSVSKKVKEDIYGNRLVIFAPLYLSNRCVNNCLYCGFRSANMKASRNILSFEDIYKEGCILAAEGHKRLLLVAAEDPDVDIEYLEKAISVIYQKVNGRGAIRRVNVNVAPMDLKDFKRLKMTGIGTYQLFQETYHQGSYKKLHPIGPKSDYLKRLYACDTAQEAGINDVGIGALFGLYDYKFETLALLYHATHLEEEFGAGPHTISVPRLEPAGGSEVASSPPYPVSDTEIKKVIAVLRLAVPYTGIILSTRESAGLRDELFHLGVSQISAGSKTSPGGYGKEGEVQAQFELSDHRTLKEVVKDLAGMGFLPSFCTACYRSGRTGEDFMKLAKPGLIKNMCHPNALLTFEEYLMDYNPELAKGVERFISSELCKISDPKVREKVSSKITSIVNGKRDIYL